MDITKNKENIKIEKIGSYNLIYLLANNYPRKALKLFIDEQKKSHTITEFLDKLEQWKIKKST